MNEIIPIVSVTLLGALLTGVCATGFSRREKNWVAGSFSMHVAFASLQVPLTLNFYGSGDMFLYFRYGELLAHLMERDPGLFIPEVISLLLQQDSHFPFVMIGGGTATGSMSALAAWCFYLLGPSKYAACIALAMLSLSGKIAIYRVFRGNLDPSLRYAAAVAALFVPSFVFWSSGLIKEALAVTGFGWSLFGLDLWIRQGRTALGWVVMSVGAVPILLFKAYILLPLVIAGGAWYYWSRSLGRRGIRIRPMQLAVAAALGLSGIVAIGHFFPEYAVDGLSTRAADLQELGRYRTLRGGSHFTLADAVPQTPLGQLVYAPAALFTALFRPLLFEVRNLLMLANAAETTLFTLLFARILFTRNLKNVRREITSRPFLVFCLVFILGFGVAVGLASSNLGTLSRYRCPILPFFVVMLLVLRKPSAVHSPAAERSAVSPAAIGAA